MKYQPGDLGLLSYDERWKGWKDFFQWVVKKAIIFLAGWPHHVVMVLEGADYWRDVKVGEFGHSMGAHTGGGGSPKSLAVYRPLNLTDRQIRCMISLWMKWEAQGIPYATSRLFAHALDWPLSLGHALPWRPVTRLLKGGHDLGRECSNGVAAVTWRCAKKDFGVHHESATPGQIWDFVRTLKHHICVRERGYYRGVRED